MTAGRLGVEGGTQSLEGAQTRQQLIAAAAFHFFRSFNNSPRFFAPLRFGTPIAQLGWGGIPVGMASPDHARKLQEKTE